MGVLELLKNLLSYERKNVTKNIEDIKTIQNVLNISQYYANVDIESSITLKRKILQIIQERGYSIITGVLPKSISMVYGDKPFYAELGPDGFFDHIVYLKVTDCELYELDSIINLCKFGRVYISSMNGINFLMMEHLGDHYILLKGE